MKDAIVNRRSIRTFANRKLEEDSIQSINDLCKKYSQVQGPFGHSFTFMLVDNSENKEGKIGTYGMLKKTQAFLGAECPNKLKSRIDYGFVLELLVLEFTKLDLGTCWVGGTFDRAMFSELTNTKEYVPAVIALGYPEKKTIKESLIRQIVKADRRKPFETVVKVGQSPLEPEELTLLELVRKAPTSSNKQPYLIEVSKDAYHIYLNRTPGYDNLEKSDQQAMDIGIILAHFFVASPFYDFKPDIKKQDHLIQIGTLKR